MDSSLDEIIASRPVSSISEATPTSTPPLMDLQKGRGGGAGGRRPDRRPQQARTSRREDFPRDGVKKVSLQPQRLAQARFSKSLTTMQVPLFPSSP